MKKNNTGVTLLELVVAIVLLGTIVMAAALSQKMGLNFINSVSKRVAIQNKARLAMEYIVRDGRRAYEFRVTNNDRKVEFDIDNDNDYEYWYEFNNEGLQYSNSACDSGSCLIKGLNKNSEGESRFDPGPEGRLLTIEMRGKEADVTGDKAKAKEIHLRSQVYRRVD